MPEAAVVADSSGTTQEKSEIKTIIGDFYLLRIFGFVCFVRFVEVAQLVTSLNDK